jgi:hypothetical protein
VFSPQNTAFSAKNLSFGHFLGKTRVFCGFL